MRLTKPRHKKQKPLFWGAASVSQYSYRAYLAGAFFMPYLNKNAS